MTPIEVYKFGGASVKDASAIKNVAKILQSTDHRPLVVVISAMGKTTNALEEIIKAHYHQPELLLGLIESLKIFHKDVAIELLGDQAEALMTDLHDMWVELGWILEEEPHPNYNYHYDQVIVFGELASTKIVSAYLAHEKIDHQWIDARGIIKTDAEYREARVLWELTQSSIASIVQPALKKHGMVITQGFIGSTIYNESTSLGREGSDYTAAVLASALDADSVTIWKDVPGIMTGDPKKIEHVTLLKEISYREAIEMTYYGAKVIHPKTIKPLQNKDIPLFVRPFDQPDLQGTKISGNTHHELPAIIVVESDQVLLQISTKDFSFVAEEHLSKIFNRVAELRIKVNSMRNTAVSFMMCVRNEKEKLEKLKNELTTEFQVKMQDGLELITIRHANEEVLGQLRNGKEILLEEQFGNTDQMVVKVSS